MFTNSHSQKLPPSAALLLNYDLFSEEEDAEQILIVDDEAFVRQLFVQCLSPQYICIEAGSVEEALTLLAENDFALVITDIMMPGMSGTDLLREILENYPDTAVVMASGIDNPHSALDTVRCGAFDYLIKPCSLDDLELTVKRALERRTLLINERLYKIDLENKNLALKHGKAELERLQAQVVHSEKMSSVGLLTAGIAHELNNPVGIIYGYMDLLENSVADFSELLKSSQPPANAIETGGEQTPDGETTLENFRSIIKDCRGGASRIRDIVQNLQTFSRIDEAEFKPTDIHEGLNLTVALLARHYRGNNVEIRCDFGKLPLIDAAAGQLNQVWMNLLVNAAQAIGKKGGAVAIETRRERGFAVINFTDNGDGIAAENLEHIFEPFFTTKSVGVGTGLGLSISFGVIERHGGTIEVESLLRHGTTFTVRLPLP